MIKTQQQKVPWWWVFLITMPVFADAISEYGCGGQAIPFTIAKFKEIPLLITLLTSINYVFNFIVTPIVAWYSDRIWTPLGRRKPLILIGWAGIVIALIGAPLAQNLITLTFLIVLLHFCIDFSFCGPYGPLQYEVIPPPQRGRSGSFRIFWQRLGLLYFAKFLIGRFDETYHINLPFDFLGIGTFSITGEQFIYWACALVVGLMIVHFFFNVKEVKPKTLPPMEHFSPLRYFKNTFAQKQWLWVYSLIFCQIALLQGMAQLEGLMITRQFGYSKAQFGDINFWIGICEIAIIVPIAGIFADKVNRMSMFKVGVFISAFHPISFWIFVKFIAANQIPSIPAIIIFNTLNRFVDIAACICLGPLIWDCIRKDNMATIFSGTVFIRGIIKVIVLNMLGLWVQVFTHLFRPDLVETGAWDYMSGFLFLFLLGVSGCFIVHAFSIQYKKGNIIEYGRMEYDKEVRENKAE